ncbi:MAG: isochorismate synthase [Flavobacteriales bacterium]|jgi:isochorismate synthase
MEVHSLRAYLQHQLEADLPFVIYRKPSSKVIQGFFQDDPTLHYAEDLSQSGFVFAPFDARDKGILIPGEHPQELHIEGSEHIVDSPFKTVALLDGKERHLELVQKGITQIKNSELKKVVLSRKQYLHTNKSTEEVLLQLLQDYPNAFVYCWYHPKIGLWVGATPETLVSIDNRQLKTMSLAGTQTFVNTQDVVWGDKEVEEQQMVTQTIVSHLEPLLGALDVSEAQTHQAGSLLHLKTDISGAVDLTAVSLKKIVEALHPTPAVCGLPKELAKVFILENEQYDREYYTGFLGELNLKTTRTRARNRRNVENLAYTSIAKNTHLFVNLRCMQLREDTASVYVGGGITAASDPDAEWQETVHKLATMGKVL